VDAAIVANQAATATSLAKVTSRSAKVMRLATSMHHRLSPKARGTSTHMAEMIDILGEVVDGDERLVGKVLACVSEQETVWNVHSSMGARARGKSVE
jgi:hypothetical protein